MKTLLITAVLCTTAPAAFAGGSIQCQSYSALTSEIGSQSFDFAIEWLRSRGQKGFDEMLQLYRENRKPELDARWRLILDRVSRQKDSAHSGLYWHTDFDSARDRAREDGKPILSLRLLGNLDEELSCANSRFFRTLLYPDPKVSARLREHFVLHWKSVRPVPKVTVDFGDGRKLERTVTGNSIHYVLDADGRVVDALPGLYDADSFLAALDRAAAFVAASSEKSGVSWEEALAAWHYGRARTVREEFVASHENAGLGNVGCKENLDANMAGMTEDQWQQLARAKEKKLRIDPVIQRIVADKGKVDALQDAPDARLANAISASKAPTEVAIIDLVALQLPLKKLENLRATLAVDSVRNEFALHRRIHERLADSQLLSEPVDMLNRWVYAELFKTPDSDPWLGLRSAEFFTAIENDGVSG